ncbi:MAG: hypothetical protein WED00_02475 [Aquisalimonadaceae bacterium]
MFERSRMSVADDVGVVYLGDGKVLRAINPAAEGNVRELINSGLIDDLVCRGLFPSTWISNTAFNGYDLVLEHERIDVVSYPYEWSPEMLKRVALCIIEVAEIARQYGYELKDAHPYNVLFSETRPVFIDLGSIVKIRRQHDWVALKEFYSSIYGPLKLYQMGYQSIFHKMWTVNGNGVQLGEYLSIRYGVFRAIGVHRTDRLIRAWFYLRTCVLDESTLALENRKFVKLLAWFLSKSKLKAIVGMQDISFEKIKKKINQLKFSRNSKWSSYQESSGFISKNGISKMPERFQRVLSLIDVLRPETVIELAANQGVLSVEISKKEYVKRVICTDYDEVAIDQFFIRCGDSSKKITPVVCNFVRPFCNPISLDMKDRFKSDLVVVLAVTHHLVLTQNVPIAIILESICSLSKKYVIVEFMPLGLWDGVSAPVLPEWYTQEWFEEELRKWFTILQCSPYEKNRVMYACEKKVA